MKWKQAKGLVGYPLRRNMKRMMAAALMGAMLTVNIVPVQAATVKDVFDAKYYADTYNDVKQSTGNNEQALYRHYNTVGKNEGRSMSELIDIAKYRAAYPDLNAAFGNNYDAYVNHYVKFGFYEGRKSFGTFDARAYADRYPDLKKAFGYDVLALYQHYMDYGRAEGRNGAPAFAAAPRTNYTGTSYSSQESSGSDSSDKGSSGSGSSNSGSSGSGSNGSSGSGNEGNGGSADEGNGGSGNEGNGGSVDEGNGGSGDEGNGGSTDEGNGGSGDGGSSDDGEDNNVSNTDPIRTNGRLVNPETGEAIGNATIRFTMTSFDSHSAVTGGENENPTTPGEGDNTETSPEEGDGDNTETPPVEGDDGNTETPPEEGDGGNTETPPEEGDGGNTETPPEEGDGGNTETPPEEGDGGNTETPPEEGDGGNTETPPEEGDGGNTETPPEEGDGGNTETPPVEGDGGNTEIPPVGGEENPTPGTGDGTTDPDEPEEGGSTVIEGDGYYEVTTDEDGYYEIPEFNPGVYSAEVRAEGYFTLTIISIYINSDAGSFTLPTFDLVSEDSDASGTASGTAVDATTGGGIAGAAVYIRENWNNRSGDVVNETTTDSSGSYNVGLARGYYTIEFVIAGYTSSFINVTSSGSMGSKDCVLSPEGNMSADDENTDYRIVLTWGQTPEDLDSHLVGPDNGDGSFHVYYSNRDYMESDRAVSLDVDDTDGYGPETITIANVRNDKTYYYSVKDFTNQQSESTAMSESGANVKVYKGAALLKEYNVPLKQAGFIWNVFKIENGQVIDMNGYNGDENTMYGDYNGGISAYSLEPEVKN